MIPVVFPVQDIDGAVVFLVGFQGTLDSVSCWTSLGGNYDIAVHYPVGA